MSPRSKQLRLHQLGMRRAGRMNNERLGIPNVGKMGEQLHAVDQLFSGFDAAFDFKCQDRPCAIRQIFLCQLIRRMRAQTRIVDIGSPRRAPANISRLSAHSRCAVPCADAASPALAASRKELNGESDAPISRNNWTRALMIYASGPTASAYTTPL